MMICKRPYLHGAYSIEEVYTEDKITSLESIEVKRIFIHRNGYLIFQNKQDEMQDFKLEIDTIQKHFILTNYQQEQRTLDFQFDIKDSLLKIQYFQNGKEYWLETKAIDWRKLPALQNDFHWTIEAIN